MKNRRESGEVVVEASIVVTLVLLIITIMLYIGMVLYQQSVVSIMANQTASNIAQVYSNNLKDPFTGYVDIDKVYQSITYGNMKTDAYMDVISQKAQAFAQYRLKSSSILSAKNTSVDVEIVKKPNELLKNQIVVTVSSSYDVPLVGLFGTNNLLKFTSSGRADCVDILEYITGVDAIGDPEHSNVRVLPDVETCIVTFVKSKQSGEFHAAVPVLRGKTIITSNKYSHSIMPQNPTLGNMKFTGWTTEDGKNFSASNTVDENITVYGTWECLVTFDPTGGTVSPTQKAVAYKSAITFPTPTRSGYSFEGWYTEKNGGGTKYVSGQTEIADNLTLYAKWQCIHKYKRTTVRAGTCVVAARYCYTCDTCGDSYEEDGPKGSHRYGSPVKIADGTCITRTTWRYYCSVCGTYYEEYGNYGDHGASARCGKDHPLGADSYKIGSHNTSNGYTKTTKGECIVCKICRGPTTLGKRWIVRNNQVVTQGMYCSNHNDKSGNDVKDGYYKSREDIDLH